MSDYLDATNEELLKDYFSESELMVDNLESNILAIENDPNNHDAIDEIFRAAHTLKGNSATVEFSEIAHFAHTMEDLLDEVRSDKVKVTEDVVDTLLTALDVIKAMLEARTNGSVYGESVDEITDKIKAMIASGGGAPAAARPQSRTDAIGGAETQGVHLHLPADAGMRRQRYDNHITKGKKEKNGRHRETKLRKEV